jgi:hypothetical protein
MLDALGELAIANPIFTHGQLPHLVSNPTLALSSFLFVLPCNAVAIFLMCFTTISIMAAKKCFVVHLSQSPESCHKMLMTLVYN